MEAAALRELGLTANESEVYLTLLGLGSVSVNVIAEKSGLHRQAVYDALDRLLEKGFVSFVLSSNRKHFQAIRPERILDYLREKEERFRGVLPSLLSLAAAPQEDTSVEVFKGKGVIRTLYNDIVKEARKAGGGICISGADERKFLEDDRIALEQHLANLRRMRCKERVLIREGDAHQLKGPQTEYRVMGKESFSPAPIFAYGSTLAFFVFGKPNYAVIVRNKELAQAYKKQFNLLWKFSKPVA
ncbi:MAG: helix-turn-helix domain-containing protein [Nanoarchaeota archaeon]|nr:helix-turn-helix domain-containing protein [Nanoarchaeota archaeon]